MTNDEYKRSSFVIRTSSFPPHGVRGVAVTARLVVNQEVRVRLPSDTPFGMMKYE